MSPATRVSLERLRLTPSCVGVDAFDRGIAMLARFLTTPLRRAVASSVSVALFAVVVRYTWGAFDPEMRSWSLLGAAPLLGVFTYLEASGREAALATLFITLGAGGLLFWTAVLVSGVFPAARADLPWLLIIYAFPFACLGLGIHKHRKLRRAEPVNPA
jgi:hypothetical protein